MEPKVQKNVNGKITDSCVSLDIKTFDLQNLKRELNILVDASSTRTEKRKSIRQIIDKVVTPVIEQADNPLLAENALSSIAPTFLKLLYDGVEYCREEAARSLLQLVGLVPNVENHIALIIPTVTARFTEGDQLETSEEVRHTLLKITFKFIERLASNAMLIVPDAVAILHVTLVDRCPEIQKTSCILLNYICRIAPLEMQQHIDAICPEICTCITHKHSTVRVVAVSAMESAMLVRCAKFREIYVVLKSCLMDSSPAVRTAVFSLAASWITNLRDRVSFGGEILYLYLRGLADELDDVRLAAEADTESIAIQYERDWPERVKSELDTLPQGVHVGLTQLVRDFVGFLTAACARDMGDWRSETRRCGVQVLGKLMSHAGSHATGHLTAVVPALCAIASSAKEDDPVNIKYAVRCAKELGRNVTVDVIFDLLLPLLESDGAQTVLAAAFSTLNLPKYKDIDFLCTKILEQRLQITNSDSMRFLFKTIVESASCCKDEQSPEARKNFMRLLLRVGAPLLNSKEYVKTVVEISPLEILKSSSDVLDYLHSTETKNGEERLLPHSECIQVLSQLLKWVDPIYILTEAAVKILDDVAKSHASGFIDLLDLLSPLHNQLNPSIAWQLLEMTRSLIDWRVGKVERETRRRCSNLARSCLKCICNESRCREKCNLDAEFVSLFISSACSSIDDDHEPEIRRSLSESLRLLLGEAKLNGALQAVDSNLLKKTLMPELVKLLDDALDDVRTSVCCALVSFLEANATDGSFVVTLEAKEAGSLAKTLLIHSDDDNDDVRFAARSTILALSKHNFEIVKTECDKIAQKRLHEFNF